MYKHFIFDIDGTLIDTERTGVLSLMDTVKALMGREMPYEEAYHYFGAPSSKVGALLGYDGPEDFGEVWEENFVRLSDLIKPFDGVGDILAAVKDAGRGTGCVTSRNRFEFDKDEHLARLLPLIDHSVCLEDCVNHKPHPEPLLKYIALAGNPPLSECIYIGDTRNDCLCARNAGCAFALADWRARGLQGIEPDHHLKKPQEILGLLRL